MVKKNKNTTPVVPQTVPIQEQSEDKKSTPVNLLPEELRDKYEIVGIWPTGMFEVTGLETKAFDIAQMTPELAEYLCKRNWKGIRKI